MIPPYQYIDSARLIPVDRHAEEALAAEAIVDAAVAVRLVDELMAEDFHDARCWRVITHAAEMPPLVDGDTEWEAAETLGHGVVAHGCAARTDAIAGTTGLAWSWLAQLVEHRSAVSIDRLTQRVAEVADMRRANRDHVQALRDAEVDVRWLTDLDAIITDARYHVLYVAQAVGAALHGDGTDADVALAIGKLGVLFGVPTSELTSALAPEGDQ